MSDTAPLHTQLYESMLQRIRADVWPAGEKVPSEKSLIAEFGVSRGPVRQALARLRAEGMIFGGRGTPPRVQRTTPAQSFGTFMSFTEWARELGVTPGQRVIEVSRRPASEQAAQELQILPGDPVVEVIRLRLLDDRPTMLERSLFPYAIGSHLVAADLDESSIYQTLAAAGIVPTRARHLIDAIAAPQLEVELLHVAPGSPLLRVRRISYSAAGLVIETADHRYLPDMANFVIENSAEQHVPLMRQTARTAQHLFPPAHTASGAS